MGYVMAHGICFGCKRVFGFHPNLVPSVVVDGRREPICQGCVNLANPARIKNGLQPIEVLPGAYDAADEGEINWEDNDERFQGT